MMTTYDFSTTFRGEKVAVRFLFNSKTGKIRFIGVFSVRDRRLRLSAAEDEALRLIAEPYARAMFADGGSI